MPNYAYQPCSLRQTYDSKVRLTAPVRRQICCTGRQRIEQTSEGGMLRVRSWTTEATYAVIFGPRSPVDSSQRKSRVVELWRPVFYISTTLRVDRHDNFTTTDVDDLRRFFANRRCRLFSARN